MAAIRIIDDHLELANIGSNTHAQIDTHIAAANNYVKRDGSLALTADWDIGDTRKILADEIRARDAAGLKLYDDGGDGIFVKDGGNVGIGTGGPGAKLDVRGTVYFQNAVNSTTAYRFMDADGGTALLNIDTVSDIIETSADFYISGNTGSNYITVMDNRSVTGDNAGIRFGTYTGKTKSWMAHVETGGYGTGDLVFAVDGSGDSGNVSITADEKVRIMSSGNVGIGTAAPTAKLDVNSDIFRLRTAKTPATAGAAGNQGDICWDADYIYVCVATNTWKRTAISTW